MTATIVIPFRGPAGAKSRLAGVLPERRRAELAMSLFRHVLATALVHNGAPVLVVTPSEGAVRHARSAGATVLRETAGDLNGALTQARAALAAEGTARMIVLPADLPNLDTDDITALLETGDSTLVIAPDQAGTGTNALCLPTGAGFDFQFGPASFAAHARQATRLGLTTLRLARPGLAADLDTADDLALLDASRVDLTPDLRAAIAGARRRQSTRGPFDV